MIGLAQPPPRRDLVVEKTLKLTDIWDRWFSWFESWVKTVPRILWSVALTAQAAAIAATPMPTPLLKRGMYRVTTYLRVTQAAGTSSSLAVTIGWTDDVACSKSGTAQTGNTDATTEGLTVTFMADAGSTITYAVAYASVGAPVAEFALHIRVEELT